MYKGAIAQKPSTPAQRDQGVGQKDKRARQLHKDKQKKPFIAQFRGAVYWLVVSNERE